MHKSSWLLLPPILEFLNTPVHVATYTCMQQQQYDLICVAFIAVTYVGVCLQPLITLGILWILVRWCCMNPLEMFTLSRVCRYTTSCWWADLLWACLCVILIYTIFACETVIANCNHISLPLSCGFTLYYTRTQTQPLTPWKHAQLIPVNTQCCWVSRKCLLSEIEITIN